MITINITITDADLGVVAGDLLDCGVDGETPTTIENWIRSNPSRVKDMILEGVSSELAQ